MQLPRTIPKIPNNYKGEGSNNTGEKPNQGRVHVARNGHRDTVLLLVR